MVQYSGVAVDRTLSALADPTRRAVLARLMASPATISELAEPFGMSLTGMKKHVVLLESADLVTTRKVGRHRECRLGPRRVGGALAWAEAATPGTSGTDAASPATRGAERWRRLLGTGGTVLADGAMGTMLFANGLEFGDPPEVWNLEHPDVIRRVHRGYLDAGSSILLTNTFGGNRFRLALHGLEGRVAEFNRTAAILLRSEVDAAGSTAIVAGDIGPSGSIMAPLGTLEFDEAVDGFAEQAAGLAAGGVDVLWIETMSALEEVHAALEGARRGAPGLPIIATMTFDTRGRTMMGVTPEQAAEALLGWGADAIGGNCGNGPDELVPVIAKMRAVAPDAVIVAKSNAGIPELIDFRTVYGADPAEMAGRGIEFREAGATIIGACCGSTPEHLVAMREALTA